MKKIYSLLIVLSFLCMSCLVKLNRPGKEVKIMPVTMFSEVSQVQDTSHDSFSIDLLKPGGYVLACSDCNTMKKHSGNYHGKAVKYLVNSRSIVSRKVAYNLRC